jgi:hypothetical protein
VQHFPYRLRRLEFHCSSTPLQNVEPSQVPKPWSTSLRLDHACDTLPTETASQAAGFAILDLELIIAGILETPD